jgi:4-hydroxybenzoyl-CoA thioesterase
MFVHQYRRRVEWSDCDPARIVFYPRYFAWFDEATWRLFEAAGFGPEALRTRFNFAGFPIGEAKSKFLAPSRFFDEIVIESHVASWRDKSFDVVHRVTNGGTPAVEGLETRIWCEPHPDDPARLKARSVPRPIVEKLGGAAA